MPPRRVDHIVPVRATTCTDPVGSQDGARERLRARVAPPAAGIRCLAYSVVAFGLWGPE